MLNRDFKFGFFIASLIIIALYDVSHSDEMPMGAYFQSTITLNSDSHMHSMHDTLGLNFINPTFSVLDTNRMKVYAANGMKCVPIVGSEEYHQYSQGHYLIVQAEDDTMAVRFKSKPLGEDNAGGWWVVGPSSGIVLDSLYFRSERTRLSQYGGGYIDYLTFLELKIDTAEVSETDTVAFLKIWGGYHWDLDSMVIDSFPVIADTFFTTNPCLYPFPDFRFPVSPEVDHPMFTFSSTGQCSLWIDSIKVFDDWGRDLIDNHSYDALILEYTNSSNAWVDSTVLSWYLRDEPTYGQFRTCHYVDQLLRDSTGIRGTMLFSNWVARTGYKEFFDLAEPETPWFDFYPFHGGWGGGWNTYYAGTQTSGYNQGLQAALDSFLVSPACDIATMSRQYDQKFYLTPQAFAGNDKDPDTSLWQWRMPTESEFSCEVFMNLCYGPSGLMFWKYDGRSDANGYHKGFVDINQEGAPKQPIWYSQRNKVNPYIKAIDDIYLQLAWDRAYYIAPDSTVPGGAWVDSIAAVSNDTIPNPDSGWFHIGQFTESSNKYVMIVNRACSQGPTNPDPAPSITASIIFDAEELDLGNYVEIIDLAKGTIFTDWEGTPDTTFCSASSNIITYSAEFRPGEGRLFKLVEVDDNFTNPVTDSVWLSKNIILLEDLVVHDTGTLIIDSCANIYVHPDSDVTIINYGEIIANGTSSDSIYFGPWIEESDTAFAGDWVGIAMEGDTASTSVNEFNYCTIRYAEIGIEMRGNIETSVTHCKILNSETSGIYNFEGSLILTNSEINENGVYGLDCVDAEDSVVYTGFHLNGSYGIRINGANSSNDESYLIANTITYTSGENNTQFGIYVKDNDYITIDLCEVNYHNQGGVKLENSDAEVLRCTFESIDNYGLYTLNGGTPVVRYCTFDTLDIGVKAVLPSIPDLGDTSTTDGDNSFLKCNDYFVHFSGLQGGVQFDSLFAQMNWWGSSSPSTRKFYHSPPNIVIVYSPYRTSAPKLSSDNPLPLEFMLNQNYPNPFNSNTILSFSLDQPAKTVVTIYNILGQKVATPMNEYLDAGKYGVTWDGRNSSGSAVASGVYFYTIQSGDRFDSKKMLLLR